MYFLNGRVTSLKRLFSLDIHSVIGRQNFHLGPIYLDKTNKNKNSKLKKFTFVKIDSNQTNRSVIDEQTEPQEVRSQPQKVKLRPQQTVKLQQTDTPKADTISPSESAVDKLARLLNLDTSKSNLFEPIENINKTESKSIQKKELNNKKGHKHDKLPSNNQIEIKVKEAPKTAVRDLPDDKIKNIIQAVKLKSSQTSSQTDSKTFKHKTALKILKDSESFEGNGQQPVITREIKTYKLNQGTGLNIFQNFSVTSSKDELSTNESPIWQMHYEEELIEAFRQPPINGFDEMIMLTDEGKLWNFPIDNEQGIDQEDIEIPFEEHVFLDNYLEEFSDTAPVQEFMTLVLNGLSKNSFMSVDEKRRIIHWYRDYFKEKSGLIEEALSAELSEQEYRAGLEAQKLKVKQEIQTKQS